MRHTATPPTAVRHRSLGRRGRALLAVGLTVAIAGCGGDETEPMADAADDAAAEVDQAAPTAAPDAGLVTPDEAAALADRAGVTVIDVRTPEEYAEGHLDGAVLIDFYGDTFADEIAALDADGSYLLYCRSGNRSGQAAELMRQLGFGQVWDLDGGVVAYARAGLPLVR